MQEVKIVVNDYNSFRFEEQINKLLEEGWRVSSTAIGEGNQRTSFSYTAILVREKPPKDTP